jgi:hypothetical protein
MNSAEFDRYFKQHAGGVHWPLITMTVQADVITNRATKLSFHHQSGTSFIMSLATEYISKISDYKRRSTVPACQQSQPTESRCGFGLYRIRSNIPTDRLNCQNYFGHS